jgi:hypothetical protein
VAVSSVEVLLMLREVPDLRTKEFVNAVAHRRFPILWNPFSNQCGPNRKVFDAPWLFVPLEQMELQYVPFDQIAVVPDSDPDHCSFPCLDPHHVNSNGSVFVLVPRLEPQHTLLFSTAQHPKLAQPDEVPAD